jgi:YHS domain-containing protein
MKTFLLSLGFVVLAASQAGAQKSAVYVSSGVAASGYDVVSYFKEAKAVKGDKKFTYHWQDADWNFSTEENLKNFKATPEKYAPQYGGYCAYGTSQGHKAPTDPQTWTIVDGKLYLNYNGDVKKKWSKDQKGLISQANQEWPKIRDKE